MQLTIRKQKWANNFKPGIIRGAPLNPNASVETRYYEKLYALIRRMTSDVERQVRALFTSEHAQEYFGEDSNGVALDASVSSQARILTRALQKKFDLIFSRSAQRIAEAFANQSDKTSSAAVHASVQQISGGLSLPVAALKGPLTDILKATVAENVALIKSIPQKYLAGVQGAVMRSITTGNGLHDLVPYLAKGKRITERRARFIAADQTKKAFENLSTARMRNVGIEEAEWLHTGGSNHPRKSHIAMTGKSFKLSDGLYDPDVKKKVMPGELPGCRCRKVAIFRFDS